MNNLFKNKAKLIYFCFGILIFVFLIASLAYMTNYAHIHVYYIKSASGSISINAESEFVKTGATNDQLFKYFANNYPELDFLSNKGFKWTIFNFQSGMSSLNTFFVIFSVVSLVALAAMLICSNHNRRVYYKSNVICGVVAPLITFALSVIAFVRNLMMMITFNENYELFNVVSTIQNPLNQNNVITYGKDFVEGKYPCNAVTFIIFAVLIAIIAIYSLVLVIFAIKKYKADTDRRNEIIRRAVENNG